MKLLYKMNIDCGRMGNLFGMFRATKEEVAAIKGKELRFGEVLGKHSDICGEIEDGQISLVTDNEEFLSMADNLGICLKSGYNPLHYYICDKCGESKNIINDTCEYCSKKVNT